MITMVPRTPSESVEISKAPHREQARHLIGFETRCSEYAICKLICHGDEKVGSDEREGVKHVEK